MTSFVTALENPLSLITLELTLLLAIAWLAHAALARRNPHWRVAVWRGFGIGAALLILPSLGGLSIVLPLLPPLVQPVNIVYEDLSPDIRDEFTVNPDFMLTPQPMISDPEPIHRPATSFLFEIWFCGAMFVLLRGGLATLHAWRFVARAKAAPSHAQAWLHALAAKLSYAGNVSLRAAPGNFSPFLTGILHPVIVVPERMLLPDYEHQLPGVLAHELAHLSGRDLAWMFLFKALGGVLWWHPLAWRVGASHAAACEQVCDLTAASVDGHDRYSQTLARVALDLAGAAPAMGLPLARPAQVRRRLAWLAREIKASPIPRKRLAAFFSCLVLIFSAIGVVRIAHAEAPPSNQKPQTVQVAESPSPIEKNVEQPAASIQPSVADSESKTSPTASSDAMQPLNFPVTITTNHPIPVSEFANLLTFALPTEIKFDIQKGASGQIMANFHDVPLSDVLDQSLNPIGLTWKVRDASTIVISASPNATPELVTHFYKIRPADGPRIRELLTPIIHPVNDQRDDTRKLLIEDEDLIIRDSRESIQEIENLMLSKGFISRIWESGFSTQIFHLKPTSPSYAEPPEALMFASRRVEAIKALLYGGEGEAAAAKNGRWIRFDQNTLDMIVRDTPHNLDKITSYLESLPQLLNSDDQIVEKANSTKTQISAIRPIVARTVQETTSGLIKRTYSVRPADVPRLRALINSVNEIRSGSPAKEGRELSIGNETVVICDTPENVKRFENLMFGSQLILSTAGPKLEIQSFTLAPQNPKLDGDEVSDFTSRAVSAIKKSLYSEKGEAEAAKIGRRLWFDSTSMELTIVDTPENLASVSQYVASLPQVRQSSTQKVIELKHAVAEEVAKTVQAVLQGESKSEKSPNQKPSDPDTEIDITSIPELNVLVVRYTNPELYRDAISLIAELDRPLKQVQIETAFVSIKPDVSPGPEDKNKPWLAHYESLANEGKARFIRGPKVLAIEGRPAEWQLTDVAAIQTYTVVTVKMTPQIINEDGVVLKDVSLEWHEPAAGSKKTILTDLRSKSGETAVLGGSVDSDGNSLFLMLRAFVVD